MTGRGGLVACAAVLLGGCTLEVPFDCSWSLDVASPPGAQATVVPMDLSGQEAIWSRRDAVEELRAEVVRVTVARLGKNNHADAVTLGLSFRPEGAPDSGAQDVVVFEGASLPLVVGGSVEAVPPDGLGAALKQALVGSGRFTLRFESEADAVVEATLGLWLAGTAVAEP